MKKGYKYLYLKDVFYELDEKLKGRKKEQAKRLPRRAVDVAYGNPSHLLDAISDGIIKSAFNSASKVVQIRAALVPVPSPDKWGGLRQVGHLT